MATKIRDCANNFIEWLRTAEEDDTDYNDL